MFDYLSVQSEESLTEDDKLPADLLLEDNHIDDDFLDVNIDNLDEEDIVSKITTTTTTTTTKKDQVNDPNIDDVLRLSFLEEVVIITVIYIELK